ncbi:MAG TPA: hypothetical protein VG322_15465 [Candidatus Acidoferrales bacterium]|jgi:hypothetical protein|nr:hypothetical protein [Candidatus Acidoferrales bacterium]
MQKIVLFCAVVFLACGIESHAQGLPINTDVVKKSVVFLYENNLANAATGFVVGIPLKNNPDMVKLAIVTARHVVDPQWAGCKNPNPQTLAVRVNTKEYTPGEGKPGLWLGNAVLVTATGQQTWFANTDSRVDAAVIPIDAPALLLANDVAYINLSDFGTPEEIKKFSIGTGAGILSAGLVPYLSDAPRNYPAFKFGRVSNVLDEPLQKSRCGPGSPPISTWTWLLAGNFVGGNSGSPIFLLPLDFTLGGGLQYTGPRPMLLGLLSASVEGADLAEMVPVEFLFEIIEKNYPDADLYRGDIKNKPRPEVTKQP